MNFFQLGDASEYGRVVAAVLNDGRLRHPRGMNTYDLGHTIIQLDNVYSGLPIGVGRNVNPAIAAVEALQLIAGVARHDLVLRVAPQFQAYTDVIEDTSARYFHGAYGARVGFQVSCAVDKLKKDQDTRQAVVTLWDPYQDNLPDKHDYPCTIGFTFSRNGEHLDMDVIMRSNDVWLGLPYDMFQFTQLQLTVATALDLDPGVYRHTALSLHAYERDFEAIGAFIRNSHTRSYPNHFQPLGVGLPNAPYFKTMHRAIAILDGSIPADATRSERWYYDKIHGGQRDASKLG